MREARRLRCGRRAACVAEEVLATARKQYPLRIDPEVWAAVERWAADEMRSANAQVEWILRDALKRAGRAPSTASTSAQTGASGEEQAE